MLTIGSRAPPNRALTLPFIVDTLRIVLLSLSAINSMFVSEKERRDTQIERWTERVSVCVSLCERDRGRQRVSVNIQERQRLRGEMEIRE